MKVTLDLDLLQLNDLREACAQAMQTAARDAERYRDLSLFQIWHERSQRTYKEIDNAFKAYCAHYDDAVEFSRKAREVARDMQGMDSDAPF